jgi:hypothetical protein
VGGADSLAELGSREALQVAPSLGIGGARELPHALLEKLLGAAIHLRRRPPPLARETITVERFSRSVCSEGADAQEAGDFGLGHPTPDGLTRLLGHLFGAGFHPTGLPKGHGFARYCKKGTVT